MLTSRQALTIVKRCIKRTSNQKSLLQNKLKDVGVSTPTLLSTLKSLIVNNTQIGVRSKGHRLKAAFLGAIGTKSRVADVRNVVRAKAEAQ